MATRPPTVAGSIYADALTLWSYHQMDHSPRPTSVGIGLGSRDLCVADHTADLYHRGLFPLIVFTGGNAPTTVDAFPRGEAVAYRERATALGVPDASIFVEPRARNTAHNITLSRALLAERGTAVDSVTLISRPYQQRRVYATCRQLWPDVDVICASRPEALSPYLDRLGADLVINMLVGDTQRIVAYAATGHAIPQLMPDDVLDAYWRLVDAGYTTRLIPGVRLRRRMTDAEAI